MIRIFAYNNFKTNLNFNNSDLAMLCGILETHRPYVTNHFFNKTKFLLCQNDGVVFRVSIPQLIYINFLTEIRCGKLFIKAVLLLFICCRSELALKLYQYANRFHYAVRCSECTLLFLLSPIITQNNNNKVYDLNIQTNDNEKNLFMCIWAYLLNTTILPSRY